MDALAAKVNALQAKLLALQAAPQPVPPSAAAPKATSPARGRAHGGGQPQAAGPDSGATNADEGPAAMVATGSGDDTVSPAAASPDAAAGNGAGRGTAAAVAAAGGDGGAAVQEWLAALQQQLDRLAEQLAGKVDGEQVRTWEGGWEAGREGGEEGGGELGSDCLHCINERFEYHSGQGWGQQ